MIDDEIRPNERVSQEREHHDRAPNELVMARQYSETSARISFALESIDRRAKLDPKQAKKTADLKQELEMWEHIVSAEKLCARLETDEKLGLTSEEAKRRLEKNGPNILTPPRPPPWYIKLLQQFLNFFNILLVVASLICYIAFALDPESKANVWLGVVLNVVVIATVIFTYVQVHKSDKMMEKFKTFLPPRAIVHRDGVAMEIEASGLVVGDLVEVKLGDKLPADVRIIRQQKLKVDNSPLTGESEPVPRTVDCTDKNPLETKNLAFFGSLAVEGTACGIVVHIADDTVFGRIAGLAAGSKSEVTSLQLDIAHFTIFISTLAICVCLTLFIYNLTRSAEIIPNLIFAIGILVAEVPQGLMATVTVCLTLAARRMASRNVLVKKLEAVETLGSTNVICSDKTGTLTQNRMTVVHVGYDLQLASARGASTATTMIDTADACFKTLLYVAACCGKAVFDAIDRRENPDLPIEERKVNGDASEAGILKFVERIHSVAELRASNAELFTIPFNSTNKFMVTGNMVAELPEQVRVCMKGAPERVMDRCTYILTSSGVKPLAASAKQTITEHLSFAMDRGERVLGFAMRDLDVGLFPKTFEFNADEPNFPLDGLTFVGLMALLDPPRESVPEAVRKCQQAGIKVIMVTGDHPVTAKAIAKQVSIIRNPTREEIAQERGIPVEEVDPNEAKAIVVPGSQIADLVEEDWDRILSHQEIVFARTSPQQKLLIVENNQRLGNIVAVTGDGVNDSPALKKANIGIAMGISGSDVSREAANLVLLDDNFSSIVNGVEEGRLIFDNLKKSVCYTVMKLMGEVAPYAALVIVKMPPALSSFITLSIDLGTDMIAGISLAYEAAESDLMHRKPRNPRVDRLVTRRLASFAYLQLGMIEVAAAFFAFFVVTTDYGWYAGGLTGLEGPGFIGATDPAKKRWMFTERDRFKGPVRSMVWFRNSDADFKFKKYFSTTAPPGFITQKEEAYIQLLPTNSTGFNNMIKAIGVETGRPPCVKFSCKLGVNSPSCFTDPTASGIVNITERDLLDNIPNSNIRIGKSRGQGCFELWTLPQFTSVYRHGQSAYYTALVMSQVFSIQNVRTRMVSTFSSRFWRNRLMVFGIVMEFVIVSGILYIPKVSKAFLSQPLHFVHWLPMLPFGVMSLFYDETRKFLIRKGQSDGWRVGVWLYDNTYW
jgi:sodium/potassium-transporting ATPase subunit alpha